MVLLKVKNSILVIILALVLAGCGIYSFSGSMRSGIETIAVPVFENKSVEFGIAEELTSGVIDEFVSDNTLKVIPKSNADAILNGTITRYDRVAYTYDENDQVQEYKVNITVNVNLSKTDGTIVWEEAALNAYGIYSADSETEEDGKIRAIAKAAEDIVNLTIRDW